MSFTQFQKGVARAHSTKGISNRGLVSAEVDVLTLEIMPEALRDLSQALVTWAWYAEGNSLETEPVTRNIVN